MVSNAWCRARGWLVVFVEGSDSMIMCPGRMCRHVFECCVQMCTYVSVSVCLHLWVVCELEFVVYIYVTESGMCVCVSDGGVCLCMYIRVSGRVWAYVYVTVTCVCVVCVRMYVYAWLCMHTWACMHVRVLSCQASLPSDESDGALWPGGAPVLSLPLSHARLCWHLISCHLISSSHLIREDWEPCLCSWPHPTGPGHRFNLGDFMAGFSLLREILIPMNSPTFIIF